MSCWISWARWRSRIFWKRRRRELPPPYDIGLVEGSISTTEEEHRIRQIRRDCKFLVAIGACATSGGIQALRNWADVGRISPAMSTPAREYISTLETATPIAAHVFVDFELRGCPVNQHQLLELVSALLAGRKPNISTHSLCVECKRRGAALRAGQRRPALPGADHANRLRGIVPRLRTCLLRLFRPHGTAEHRRPGQLVHGPAWAAAPRNETHDPPLQRILGTFQASE